MAATKVHWRAPAMMAGSLLAAIAFAVGHHLFYSNLAGQVVPIGNYTIAGFTVSVQQANIASGTALAFLVKACLVLAIGTAYTQVFWQSVSGRSTTVSMLDRLAAALQNFLLLLHWMVWWKYPLLLLVALIAWLLPLASVISPATLNVVTSAVRPVPSEMLPVPRLDFTSLNFPANMVGKNRWANEYYYDGPHYALQDIAMTVAAQGNVLTIGNLGSNATWSISFTGPILRCSEVQGSTRDTLLQLLKDNLYITAAWTPGATTNYTGSALPFAKNTTTIKTDSLGPLDNATSEVAALYFAVVPNTDSEDMQAAMIRCELWNSSYSVTFSDATDGQYVKIENSMESSDRPVRTIASLQARNPAYVEIAADLVDIKARAANVSTQAVPATSHATVVWPGAPALTATTTYTAEPYSTNIDFPTSCNATNPDGERCVFNQTARQVISYQSVMDAFGKLFVGGVSVNQTDNELSIGISTQIMATTLVNAWELRFLDPATDRAGSSNGSNWEGYYSQQLQELLATNYTTDFPDLTPTSGYHRNASLAEMAEALFRNITVSLMSSSMLCFNDSLPNAPPWTNVTRATYHTIYTYAQLELWLAYGLAIGSSTLACLIGYIALVGNGAAFSNDFSTILRTTKHAELTVELKDGDTAGHDPLPKYLANAKVRFRKRTSNDPSSLASEKPASVTTVGSRSNGVSASTSLLGPFPFESPEEREDPAFGSYIGGHRDSFLRSPGRQGASADDDQECDLASPQPARTLGAVSGSHGRPSDVSEQDVLQGRRDEAMTPSSASSGASASQR